MALEHEITAIGAENTTLKGEIGDLRRQLAELRLVVAAIHPEFFDRQSIVSRSCGRRNLWVARGGIATAVLLGLLGIRAVRSTPEHTKHRFVSFPPSAFSRRRRGG